MRKHRQIEILKVGSASAVPLEAFTTYLRSMPHVLVSETAEIPESMSDVHLVITIGDDHHKKMEKVLSPFVKGGGAWLHIVGCSEDPIPELFGGQPGPLGPTSELRILYTKPDNSMAERLNDAFYVPGKFQSLQITADDTETVIYADWHYTHQAVVTCRTVGHGHAACTTLQAFDLPDLQRIFYRLIRMLTKHPFGESLGVGILGYAPSVGRLHGQGCRDNTGLELVAACDLNKARLDQAHIDFPEIKRYESGDGLADDPDVELIIIATPPNTHADLCLQMMGAGKHVVCEKPLAINQKETDSLINASEKFGVHLSCHQNRRFDVDYRVVRNTIEKGWIGTPFYLETFVGGYSHPCGYWHSHAPVSGGTIYDWGAHYLDWIVSLFPDPIESVVGTRHKLVWHDVTNADQERIQIRFSGGQEAEFVHSDIAAARKPKWYVLGTQGAIVGDWNDVTDYEPDPDLYFRQTDIPATEMPPDLTVYRRNPTGTIDVTRPAIPVREHYAFHRNLADHLLIGEPLAAPLSDSVKVVAILETAVRSMEKGGSVEAINA